MISRPLPLSSFLCPHMRPSAAQQRGVVLLVSLLFLIVLTLLGVAASRMVTSEERQSRYLREYNTAFQAAESAMRDARDDIDGLVASTPPRAINVPRLLQYAATNDCQFGFCTYDRNELTRPWKDPSKWANATPYGTYSLRSPLPQSAAVGTNADGGRDENNNTVSRFSTATATSAVTGVSQQPVYLIEPIETGKGSATFGVPQPITYRVTALGYGADPNTRAMVQEIVCNPLACAGFVK